MERKRYYPGQATTDRDRQREREERDRFERELAAQTHYGARLPGLPPPPPIAWNPEDCQ